MCAVAGDGSERVHAATNPCRSTIAAWLRATSCRRQIVDSVCAFKVSQSLSLCSLLTVPTFLHHTRTLSTRFDVLNAPIPRVWPPWEAGADRNALRTKEEWLSDKIDSVVRSYVEGGFSHAEYGEQMHSQVICVQLTVRKRARGEYRKSCTSISIRTRALRCRAACAHSNRKTMAYQKRGVLCPGH
jgi:hypothetical protein